MCTTIKLKTERMLWFFVIYESIKVTTELSTLVLLGGFICFSSHTFPKPISSPHALYNSCNGFQFLFSLLRLQLFLLFPLPLLVAPQYESYCFSKIEDRSCNRSCASCSLAASYILKVFFVRRS